MSDTKSLHRKASSQTPATEVGAGAPQPALCQVRAIIPAFKSGWCLVRPIPYDCPLGFIYRDGYLCRHPEIGRIIERTRAQELSRKPKGEQSPPRKG